MKAYLLAAGRGRRAGGPKALRVTDGKTALKRQVEFLLTVFKPEEIAVSVQEEWLSKLGEGVRWIAVNPDLPALASIQALMRKSPIDDWASLHHVDMPVFDKALFARPNDADAEAVIPSFEGRKGHPVLLSRKLQAAILALDPNADRLDCFLRGRKTKVVAAGAMVLANDNT